VAPDCAGFSFTVHRFPSLDNVELEAWHILCKQPKGMVLMFYGYAASKSSLLGSARGFHELGYDTFLVDFRGSGGSAGNETTIGVREADDVAAAYAYARMRWPKQAMALFGQSMGSAAIMRALTTHDIHPDAALLESPFDRMLATVENRFVSMNLPSFPLAHLLVFWGGVQHGFNGFSHNPVTYAERVTCPVLLLHGTDDVRVTQAQAEDIFSHLAGPKRFQLFPGFGHGTTWDNCPIEWKKTVGDFLHEHMPAK
jgi:alpha-beta hydrolase superfamily lysophospholipase